MAWPDAKTIAEFLGFLILIVLNLGRRIGQTEAGGEGNGCEKRLRQIEERMAAFEVAGTSREKRLDDIHRKMSEFGDREEKFIGQAMDRFVSKRECDARHDREG